MDKALDNHDLKRLANKLNIKNFRGIFMRDSLPSKINKKESGIVNLDSINNCGTHWVAYNKNNNRCFYFDSFGLDPPKEIKNYLKFDIVINTFQIQELNTNYCGQLCILFLKLMEQYKFEDIIFLLKAEISHIEIIF